MLLTDFQKSRLRRAYFGACDPEGNARFADVCLKLSRQGYRIHDFFASEDVCDLYSETLDEAMQTRLKTKAGHLYLAANAIYSPGLYKIGLTRQAPADRMRSLRTAGIPSPFTLVKAWAVPDVFAAEASAHRLLRDRRVEGEFYEGTHSLLARLLEDVVEREWGVAHDVCPNLKLPNL